jgi:hypothetical protein
MTPAVTASFSRPQKTSSPTFQMPFCRTEDPLAPLATVVPIAARSYLTAAFVAEVSFTESTLDVTAAANGLDWKAPIAEVNCEPFSSNCTRLLFGVAGLKNAFQLVVISETALAVPPVPAEGATDGANDADGLVDEAGRADDEDPGVDEEELELLEQADIAVTSARPSAGAR